MKPLILILLFALNGIAQSGTVRQQPSSGPKEHIVTVTVRDGDPLKGRLVSADNEAVVIENGPTEMRIKTDNVTSIAFEDSTPETPPKSVEVPSRQSVAAGKILTALRRLDNAVGVGVMLQNYSALMIESKTTIDENLKEISDESIANGIQQVLNDHQYALTVWNLAAVNGWAYFLTKQEPGRTIITRYGYPMKISVFTQIPVMSGLGYVWLAARNRFNDLNLKMRSIVQPDA